MTREKNLETMLTISMGFLVLHFVFDWDWAILVSLFIGLTGIFSNFLSRKISWFWYKIAEIFGLIVPKILLTIVYFLFLYPISIVYKLFNKDTLHLKRGYRSHFTDRNIKFEKSSFEKPW